MPALATCTLLKLADAIAAEIPTLFPSVGFHEIAVTFFKRFNAEATPGLNVYIIARQDEGAPIEQGGDRDHDPNFHELTIAVCERVPAVLETFSERDAHVRERVNLVAAIRDRFNPRIPVVIGDTKCTPVSTSVREVCDFGLLDEHNVFESSFDVTIREE